ncbi:MAG: ERCC4 domain-containing protein [Armatimonadota bacterium]
MKAKPVVVVDTREKEPYTFDPARVEVVRRALAAGDYSLLGLESSVAVERKSMEDFVGTVIRGRERFANELAKLRGCEFACVVVEGSLMDVLSGNYRSDAHPNAVLGSALSIIVDYRIPVFFCSNRQAARLFVEQLLLRLSEKVDATCQNQEVPRQS